MRTVIILFVFICSTTPAYAVDMMSGAVGYAIGKSGNRQTTINNGGVEMGVLPYDCTLYDGRCITEGGMNSIPIKAACGTIGPDYTAVGFKKVGTYASQVIILCKEIKTGCAKCHTEGE